MPVELSILIPALFERQSELPAELIRQIGDRPVELLVLSDNRKRSTGLKRQALLDLAQGRYVTHLDDDDWVAPTYIDDVLAAIAESEVDVIVFNQESTWNGENPFIVRCGLEFENEGIHKDPDGKLWQDIHRKPWHWCVWNAKVAHLAKFPDGYIDDDWFWLKQAIALCGTQRRIDKVLHYYRHNSKTSASQQGKPTVTE
jgi:hypothetical protein